MSEPGLCGLGCATFTQRHTPVKAAVEEFLRPFLRGKETQRIEDIWRTSWVSSYWRNGPVLNNALSGVDMALWDIKAKLAGMPLYELLGGKCREGVTVYRHADGRDASQVEERARAFIEQGYRVIRCQMGGYQGAAPERRKPEGALPGAYHDPDASARNIPRLFDHLRSKLGFEVELLHDIHERLPPFEAVRLAKALEPYRLFFLEDALPPEQIEWFRAIRRQCVMPLAMGELFTNPCEWMPLIENRLIDFIRCHVSAIGGITPARKLAALVRGVRNPHRVAWAAGCLAGRPRRQRSPRRQRAELRRSGMVRVSPTPSARSSPAVPRCANGYAYPNDRPGLGIDLDEAKAAKYPCSNALPEWTLARLPDGTAAFP